MTVESVLRSNCRSCSRSTRHEVVHALEVERKDSYFNEKDQWQIIRCLGCHTVAFRHQNDDFKDVKEDSKGNAKHATTVKTYPRVIANHQGLKATYYLPPLISKVYDQTLRALGEQANVLASIGLRACIEAVCNHLELSATNLEKRIDQLFKAGHVSNGDKKRLHAIRFLGNDAAHEIREPETYELRVALEIIEHLLNTVFILEQRSSRLEIVAETYPEFLKLVQACASKYEAEAATSLAGLLGRQRRLVGQQFDEFEGLLQADIRNGAVEYLKLGQSQAVANKSVQLYEVDASLAGDDDDIPF